MVDWKYSSSLFFKRVFSLNLSPNENQLIATTMEPVAADPEFMQKMSTLKWSKDEQYIKTPEYEKRRSALFDSHFGRPASLAGAKPRKKKTSTASDEEETSSGNSVASDEDKASSVGSKKRPTQSKDAKLASSARTKKRRFGKISQVIDQIEEYCVTVPWVHNVDFTGKAAQLKIPYKYDCVACFSSGCVAQPALHRFTDKDGTVHSLFYFYGFLALYQYMDLKSSLRLHSELLKSVARLAFSRINCSCSPESTNVSSFFSLSPISFCPLE